MRKIICVLLLMLMAEQGAQAATAAYATTPYFTGQRPIVGGNYPNPAVNPQTNATAAVGDLIAQNQVKNGFAANDPRISTTVQNAGTSIIAGGSGAIVGGLAGAGVTTLCLGGTAGLGSFGCAALGIVVSSAVGAGVQYAVGSLLGWLFNSDGTVTVSGSAGAPYTGSYWWWINGKGYPNNQSGATAACQSVWSSNGNTHVVTAAVWGTGCTLSDTPYVQSYPMNIASLNTTSDPSYVPVGSAATTVPVATAVSGLTPAQLALPLDANTLAATANAALAAAQNVPGSLPAVASNPITAADAQAEISAMGANAPTVGDLFSPIQSGQVANAASAFTPASALAAQNATSPLSGLTSAVAPSTSAVTAAAPSTAPATNINLGTDPAIGSPPLDQTPDGPTIMAPLTTGLSSYTGFSVAMPQGVCPAPTFDFHPVWPITVHSTEICTMYDSISGKIAVVMTLAWAFLFLLIILKA